MFQHIPTILLSRQRDQKKKETDEGQKSSRKKKDLSKADPSEKEGRQALNVAMREKDTACGGYGGCYPVSFSKLHSFGHG